MAGHLLAAFGWVPARAGVFLDFDGVLADIAVDPDAAVPRPGVPALLESLNERVGRLAIVSGRPVEYLARHLPESIDLVGLYGLEWRHRGQHHTLHEAEEWRATFRDLTEEASVRFGSDTVEPKGLSLTVHYRRHRHLDEPMGAWVREVAAATGAHARPAKQSYELHPPIRRDKGTVVLDLAADLDPVLYVGDDLGDLPAFDALDELAGRGVAAVRVAVASSEAPPILLSRADHVADGPAAAEELLVELVGLVAAAPGSSG